MRLTLAPTVEAVSRWSPLAPRVGRKPATVTLPGETQRYLVRSVEMLAPIGPLVVELVPYVELADFAAARRAG